MLNTVKTTLLLGLLTGLFLAAGQWIGGDQGMGLAFVLAIAMNFGSYWFSDKIVLALHNAKEVSYDTHPDLMQMVYQLARRAELPMPRVYIVPNEAPNAFATGRDAEHAAIAFSEGILTALTPAQLSGVTGHELAHVKNRDILISSIAACIAGAISMIAHMAQWAMLFGRRDDRNNNPIGLLIGIIITPIAASLIQMAISRSREFQADATGAAIHGNAEDLASALATLHIKNEQIPQQSLPSPAMAHMYIVSPIHGKALLQLFSTHPPVEQRIARLKQLAMQPHQ